MKVGLTCSYLKYINWLFCHKSCGKIYEVDDTYNILSAIPFIF